MDDILIFKDLRNIKIYILEVAEYKYSHYYLSSHSSLAYTPILQFFAKEYKIEGRYNWRGPPYHVIIHAFCRRYSICIRNIQNRLLYTR